MSLLRNAIAISLAFVLSCSIAQAATIHCAEAPQQACVTASLSGVIVTGDYERVNDFVVANRTTLHTLSLTSPGGAMEESIDIGRLVRTRALDTVADGFCGSGCALVWLGGKHRAGAVYVWVHQPVTRTTVTNLRYGSFTVVTTGGAAAVASIRGYLTDMGATEEMIDSVLAPSPHNDGHPINAP